jgi:hydrogenase maturation factor HypF (carbamoyltransferase family)
VGLTVTFEGQAAIALEMVAAGNVEERYGFEIEGGELAVRQPWRMALSYLRDMFGQQIPGELPCFHGVEEKQRALVDAMLARRLQTVETSSCGRLFDAVAAPRRLRAAAHCADAPAA